MAIHRVKSNTEIQLRADSIKDVHFLKLSEDGHLEAETCDKLLFIVDCAIFGLNAD
jgi:hypothetical protein